MRISVFLIIVFLLFSCSEQMQVEKRNNVIYLADAIANPIKMNLSEIVDSLTFIPMDSEPSIKDRMFIGYSKPYIIVYPASVFNMQGQFLKRIGSLGQGPGEESNSWGYSVYYDEDKDLFYTKGDKIIQFNKNGVFTGTEIRVTYRNKEQDNKVSAGLKSPYEFVRSGKYNVLINYPDSAFWIDKNLQTVKKERLIPNELFLNSPGGRVSMPYTFFTRNDTSFYFNCYTDEISAITEEGMKRKWKLDLGQEKADNRCFLNYEKQLIEDEMVKIIRGSARNPASMKIIAENSKLAKLIDGKKWINKAWESDRYILINWTELLAFQEYRSGRNTTYWAIYDKKEQKTSAINYLFNDMDGCVDFSPSNAIIGVNDGILMTSIWPYTIHEYVQKKKEKGEPIDSRLKALIENYNEEDNPILVLAYLKK